VKEKEKEKLNCCKYRQNCERGWRKRLETVLCLLKEKTSSTMPHAYQVRTFLNIHTKPNLYIHYIKNYVIIIGF